MKSLLVILTFLSLQVSAAKIDVDHIIVSGTGEVNINPDLVVIYFGVKTKSKTALEAQNTNAIITTKVVAMLKSKFSIKKKDIQTTSFKVSPHIQYLKHGKRKIDGYNVQNRFRLKFRKLKKIGKVLDQLTLSGVNDIGSISFSTEKHAFYEKEAMKLAMINAKEKATILAQEANRKIGKVIRIIHGQRPDHGPGPMMEMGISKSMTAETPVATGEISVTTKAIVTYELK